ncbi:hypothetical protein HanIR_Chr17g0853861 [Helianthus annuus]|nr:hypothetical protein HanIR_Chr17g0853861 [Helianthus annuus]
MASGSMKDMIIKENKLEKFEGVDFRRWQKKIVTLWDFPEHYLVYPCVYILIIK